MCKAMRHAQACIAILCLTISTANATVRTVGSTADCGYSRPEDALAAANNGDEIHLADSFTGVAALVFDRQISLIGGFASCSAATPTANSVLDGQGEPLRSILTLRGRTSLSVRNVTFSHGDEGTDTDGSGPDDGTGGAIDYQGTGTLTLNNVVVEQSIADLAGGLYFKATNGAANLVFEDKVYVRNNQANSGDGGGILLSGVDFPITVSISGIGQFSNNVAYERGGGIFALGEVSARLGTRTTSATQAYFESNSAGRGGGAIAMLNLTAREALVQLYSTASNRPLIFSRNSAMNGGALYVVGTSLSNQTSRSSMCAWNASFDRPAGTFSSVATVHGARGILYMNPMSSNQTCGPPPADATPCFPGAACTLISGTGMGTAASVFSVAFGGSLILDRVESRGQTTTVFADAFAGAGIDPYRIALSNTLIARNSFSVPFRFYGTGSAELRQVTLVDNTIGGDNMIEIGSDTAGIASSLNLHQVILDQPNKVTIANMTIPAQPISVVARYAASTDISTLPFDTIDGIAIDGAYPRELVPGYVNQIGGNYRLRMGSALTDRAQVDDTLMRDLDNHQRTRDLPFETNVDGARDFGAYETPLDSSEVFSDGFD